MPPGPLPGEAARRPSATRSSSSPPARSGHAAIYTDHVARGPHPPQGHPARRRDTRLPDPEAALMRCVRDRRVRSPRAAPLAAALRARRLRAEAAAGRATTLRAAGAADRAGARRLDCAPAARPAPCATTGSPTFDDAQLRRAGRSRRSPTTPTCAWPRRASSRRPAMRKLAGATLYPPVNLLARGGGKLGGDSERPRAAPGSSPAGSSTSGGACALGREAGARAVRGGGARRGVRAPVDRRAGRQELVPRDRGAPAARASPQEMAAAVREARGARARPRCASAAATSTTCALAQASVATATATPSLQLELAEQQAIRALETLVGRYPGGGARRRAPQLPALPGPGAGGPALGAARAPPRRRRRRAARRRGVQPGRRGEGRAPAAHLAHREREQHLERPVRAEGSRQPGLERRAPTSLAPIFIGGALEGAGRDPHRRAEGRPSPTTGASARARSAKSRTRCRRASTLDAARARSSRAPVGEQRARARARPGALPRRARRSARGAAADPRAVRGAHGAARARRASGWCSA